MAGLNLLQEYLSDSDEEKEQLDNETKIVSIGDIKKKLPIPESILSWKGVMHHEEIVDDPLQHNGRIRSFKHERGNWSTLVYIDYIPSDDMLLWMKSIKDLFIQKGNLFEKFHVSLTRTLILKFHWINSFVEAVKNIIDGRKNFLMELGIIRIYCNEEKTRTFLGINVQSANNSLEQLTQDLDKLVDEYQLPRFYENASYHISFFWCLGDQRKTLETILPSLRTSFELFLADNPEQQYLHIDQIKCKSGNKSYNFCLQ